MFKNIWDEIDKLYDPKFVLTEDGHAFVQTFAIKAAHAELPFASHFLSMMPALTNGAKIKMSPNSASPLFMFHLNVNYAQTRKSSLTGNADLFGDALDRIVSKRVKAKFDEMILAEQAEFDGDRHRKPRHAQPRVVSSVFHAATPEAFFERCAGDFTQVANLKDVDLEDMDGRFHNGVLVNLDEAYDLLLAFGLLSDVDKPGKQIGRVNPHQSSLNKLMQYGQAARITKSCGAYGQGRSPAVTVSIAGNLHPSMCGLLIKFVLYVIVFW